jgi:ligand-binding sensor domain-containing protein
MRPPLFSLLPILLLAGNSLCAQEVDEAGFTRYTRTEGLSNNYISGIVQDSLGYIWVATRKGLNRFDGRFFTGYYTGSPGIPLPSDNIQVLKLQHGEIVGGTWVGAFAFNPVTGGYKTLIVPGDSIIAFWANNIYDISRDSRGKYLLSTKTGLYFFDSGRLIRRYDHYQPADAGRVEMFPTGQFYELSDGTVLNEEPDSFEAFDAAYNRNDGLLTGKHPGFKKVITDSKGKKRLCYTGLEDELYFLNRERNSLDRYCFRNDSVTSFPLPFSAQTELDDNTSLFVLGDSLLALTGRTSGFFLLDEHHVSENRHAPQQPASRGKKYFDGKECHSIFRDREGRIWVGTNEGLYKENLSNPFFTAYDLSKQLPDLGAADIRKIWSDPANLYIGLRNKAGILILDKTTKQIKRRILLAEKNSAANNISAFFPYSADTLWVGTQLGLFWLNRVNYHSGRVPAPPSLQWLHQRNTLNFLQDRNRNIWFASDKLNSIVRYDRATRQFTEISDRQNPLLKITYCFSIAEDRKGNIWLAGDGLCRWNPGKQIIDTLIPYPSVGKALRNYMQILDCDKENNLWIYSYDNGIIQFNCDNGRMYLRKEDNGLTDGEMLASSPIIHDNIWLGMEYGIAAFNTRDHSTRSFAYAEDLPTLAMTSIGKAFYYDAGENIFYFGSKRHLISFRPELSDSHPTPPPLFIDETGAGNAIQLHFNTIDFTNPEGNRFAYTVTASADTNWRLLDWQRTVNFNNLSPAIYHVRLKLFSVNNRWPAQYKDITLVVPPPFWKTTWFIIAAGLTISLVAFLLYRFRISRIREKLTLDNQIAEYEMKALHAQMNPHFIFNALNSIREMILHDENRNASRYLSRFARLIRLNLEHSRLTFITLRQNIEYLEAYLEMEQLRFANFTYAIDVSGEIDSNECRIAPMLIQPLVENAIWHGLLPKQADKSLRIDFFLRDGQLVCEIDDNGIGIRESLQKKGTERNGHQSMGIANIRQRIAVLNEKYHMSCSLCIEDKTDIPGRTDAGTLITLMLPPNEAEEMAYSKNHALKKEL